MSWLFSQALVEEYSEDISSAGEPSVQSSGNPTQLAYLPPDKMTAFSRLSRFGMTFKPLTADRGAVLLTSYLADFHAKTSHQPAKAPASTELDQECGAIWLELLAKYDQDSSTWKTPQCSLFEDSEPSLETWPRWGSMRDGVSFLQQTLVPRIKEIGSGLWPTPVHSEARQGLQIRREGKKGTQQSLTTAVLTWPTPRTKGMCGGSGAWNQLNKATTLEEARQMGAGNGGQLNPTWVEWLMGWPLGWTDLKPLATDKFLLWQQQHSDF
jgi:hypothetical protein